MVQPETTLNGALNEMLNSSFGSAIVVDRSGAYQGIVDIETIMTAIQAMRRDARDRARETVHLDEGEVAS